MLQKELVSGLNEFVEIVGELETKDRSAFLGELRFNIGAVAGRFAGEKQIDTQLMQDIMDVFNL